MTRLEARVKAVNKSHAYAIKLHEALSEFFKGYVGKKITKADKRLLKRIEDAMPDFPQEDGVHVYFNESDYFLAWGVRAWETYPDPRDPEHPRSMSEETSVYVGRMRNGTLVEMSPTPDLRTDYTVEEVNEKRAAFKQARDAFDEARSALRPFGEHDNH